MYKNTARSLRRATNVHAIAVSPIPGYVFEDDLIVSADNMGWDECQRERTQLILEKTRLENELLPHRREGNIRQMKIIGGQLQTISGRLSLVNKRLKQLNVQRSNDLFYQAAKEMLPAETLRAINNRAAELRESAA